MALFRRKSEVEEEVPELEQYYAQRRTSSAWSWLMALVTMILTILIIIGLFFGGRWVYRELISNDQQPSTPTVNAPAVTEQTTVPQSGVTTLPAGESAENSQAQASNPPTVNGGTQQPVTSSTNATSGQTTNILPNSGPGSVALLALIVATGTYLSRIFYLARVKS